MMIYSFQEGGLSRELYASKAQKCFPVKFAQVEKVNVISTLGKKESAANEGISLKREPRKAREGCNAV